MTLWSAADGHTALLYAAFSVVLKLAIFLPFGLYSRLWLHASIPDLAKITVPSLTDGSPKPTSKCLSPMARGAARVAWCSS